MNAEFLVINLYFYGFVYSLGFICTKDGDVSSVAAVKMPLNDYLLRMVRFKQG